MFRTRTRTTFNILPGERKDREASNRLASHFHPVVSLRQASKEKETVVRQDKWNVGTQSHFHDIEQRDSTLQLG